MEKTLPTTELHEHDVISENEASYRRVNRYSDLEDIVKVGKGGDTFHRPDGKFLSRHELDTIQLHSDEIREYLLNQPQDHEHQAIEDLVSSNLNHEALHQTLRRRLGNYVVRGYGRLAGGPHSQSLYNTAPAGFYPTGPPDADPEKKSFFSKKKAKVAAALGGLVLLAGVGGMVADQDKDGKTFGQDWYPDYIDTVPSWLMGESEDEASPIATVEVTETPVTPEPTATSEPTETPVPTATVESTQISLTAGSTPEVTEVPVTPEPTTTPAATTTPAPTQTSEPEPTAAPDKEAAVDVLADELYVEPGHGLTDEIRQRALERGVCLTPDQITVAYELIEPLGPKRILAGQELYVREETGDYGIPQAGDTHWTLTAQNILDDYFTAVKNENDTAAGDDFSGASEVTEATTEGAGKGEEEPVETTEEAISPEIESRNVTVKYGHGFTDAYQQIAKENGVVLNDAQSFKLHKYLFGKYDEVLIGAKTYPISDQEFDVGIMNPGTYQVNPAVYADMLVWMNENVIDGGQQYQKESETITFNR